ncbi:alpha/beta fold hydrolase [Streptomyces sp. NPDC007905]|uniref:thioesterase II family protein n=1 Tax=Streptomyces sp. NPDC007905 TaxID=3364788 RepID=UPI0036E36118
MSHSTGAAPAGRFSCPLPRPDAPLRLFCFPHSGAGPTAFRTWPRLAGEDVEVHTAVLPGRGERAGEPPATDWRALVAEFAEAVEQAAGDGADAAARTVLFGQSLGAVLAFEVARLLRAAGREPARLVVAGRAAPDVLSRVRLPADDRALVDHVAARYGGIPDALRAEPELIAYFARPLRADLRLAERYAYAEAPPLSAAVAAFAGEADDTIGPGELERWGAHTTGPFTSLRLPGGHLCSEGNEAVLLAAVRDSHRSPADAP